MFRILVEEPEDRHPHRGEPFAVAASLRFPGHRLQAAAPRCEECVRACPTGAIHSWAAGARPATLSLSYALCIQCRECVEACPEQAISAGRDVEVAAYTREQLQQTASFDVDRATGRGTFRQVEMQPGPSLAESAATLRERIRGRLGRSLHVRQVDAGSCNGCELEIAATTNPLFDLERFGDPLRRQPRHADLLLVTGPVTRNMEIALRRTYEATPEPRVVVAVGACGCSGGIFGEGDVCLPGRRRPRGAGGRLRSRVPAAPAGDSQRAPRGDGSP